MLEDGMYSVNFGADLLFQIESGYVRINYTFYCNFYSNQISQKLILLRKQTEFNRANKKFQCTTLVSESKFNLCQFGKMAKSTIILDIILKAMMASSSFSYACPFSPNRYTLTDMKMPSSVPLPLPKESMCIISEIYARSKNFKKIEKVTSFETIVNIK